MKFLVRKNCEYSLVVEAPTEDAALLKADETPTEDWESTGSSSEVDDSFDATAEEALEKKEVTEAEACKHGVPGCKPGHRCPRCLDAFGAP